MGKCKWKGNRSKQVVIGTNRTEQMDVEEDMFGTQNNSEAEELPSFFQRKLVSLKLFNSNVPGTYFPCLLLHDSTISPLTLETLLRLLSLNQSLPKSIHVLCEKSAPAQVSTSSSLNLKLFSFSYFSPESRRIKGRDYSLHYYGKQESYISSIPKLRSTCLFSCKSYFM